jgi:hypothetical protein
LTKENFGRRLGYVAERFTGESEQFAIEEVMALRRLNVPVVPFALFSEPAPPEVMIAEPAGEVVALNVPFAGLRRSIHLRLFAQHPLRYWRHLLASPARRGFSGGVALAYFAELYGVRHLHARGLGLPLAATQIAANLSELTFTAAARPSETRRMSSRQIEQLLSGARIIAGSFHQHLQILATGRFPQEQVEMNRWSIDFLPVDLGTAILPRPLIVAHVNSPDQLEWIQTAQSQAANAGVQANWLVSYWSNAINLPGQTISSRALNKFADWHKLLGRADLMVLSSARGPADLERSLRQLLIGMAMGVPGIAGDDPEFAEIFTNGRYGLIAPQDDGRILGQAVISLLQDDQRRAAMASRARDRFAQAHSLEKNARQLVALLQPFLLTGMG